jgi:TolB protein
MKPDGSGERLLTSSYLDEGPSWAPNSRVIMYSHQIGAGGARLYTVDISGRAPQPAPYPLNASDPAWSSLLP